MRQEERSHLLEVGPKVSRDTWEIFYSLLLLIADNQSPFSIHTPKKDPLTPVAGRDRIYNALEYESGTQVV